VKIRAAGAALLVSAALGAGCGSSATPHLSTNQYATDAPENGLSPSIGLQHPGQRVEWRITVFNQGRTDIVLDRVELVLAHGVTLHDVWTIDPASSQWEIARSGWTHDPGSTALAGTVVPPVSDTARQGKLGVDLTIDVTMPRTGIYGSVGGLRVWAHEGGRHYGVVLPVDYTGCFIYPSKSCPYPSATDTPRALGLKYTKPR
jgi:hypothetical protein